MALPDRSLRPWPSTGPNDWCHLYAARGGLPGGRGAKLTNQEIVAAVEEEGGMPFMTLQEKIRQNGLTGLVAERRIKKLLERRLLVEADGLLQPGDGEAESHEPTTPPSDRADGPGRGSSLPGGYAGQRAEHHIEDFLPALRGAAPSADQPAGFNQLYRAAGEVLSIGKGTFTKLVRGAVQNSQIRRLEAGPHAGKYWVPAEAPNSTEVDLP